MKFKRIISTVLIVVTLFSFISVNTLTVVNAAVPENEENYYQNRLALLIALGILSEDSGAAEDNMSEEVFVKGALTVIGYDDYIFTRGKSAIELAKERGFYGNDLIKGVNSSNDAYVLMLNALGYGVVASGNGGGVSAYLAIASREKLNKNVKAAETLTNENGVTILYNALFMNMCDSVGKDKYGKISGTVLENTFNTYQAEGLVTGVYLQSLFGDAPEQKDEIVVDNVTYKTNMDGYYLFFGKYINYYYTINDNDDKELLYAWCDENNYLTIDASFVTNITKKGKVYKIDYNDIRGEKYSESVTPKYVSLNGEEIDYLNTDIGDLLDFYTGSIVLTDTDNDSNFDCILIEKYENYILSTVTEKAIYDVNGKTPIYLDDENDEYWYEVYINGKENTLSAAYKNDVLSIYKNSKGNIVKISSTKNEIIGTADEIINVNNGHKVIIDGLPYFLPEGSKIPSLGCTGVFYLDSLNVIAGFDLEDIYNYAYLIAAGTETFGRLKVKLCEEGAEKAEIFDCADKILVKQGSSNRKKLSGSQALDVLNSNENYMPGLIKYRKNPEGLITAIILPEDVSENPHEADPSVFNFAGKASANEVKISGGKLGKFAVDVKNVVAFSIPVGNEGDINDTDYIGNLSIKNNDSLMTPMYYDVDGFLTAGAIVTFHKVHGDGLVLPTQEIMDLAPSVVKKIEYIQDTSSTGHSVKFTFIGRQGEYVGYAPYSEKGMVYNDCIYKRKYSENGYSISDATGSVVKHPIIIDTTKLFDDDCTLLNVGDFVYVRVDENDRVAGMTRLWSNKKNGFTIGDPTYDSICVDGHFVSARNSEFYNNNWWVFAEFINRNDSFWILDATNYETRPGLEHPGTHEAARESETQMTYGGVTVFPFPPKTTPVYILYRDRNDLVVQGTLDDIRAGDEVVFNIYYGTYNGVVVIK